jgi:DNA-binding PadR family transcriptional regulator
LTATEAAVLGLLADGEHSGYDLAKRAEESVGHIWAPAKSQLYAVLPRLAEAGLARRRSVRQARRPDKQLYRMTAAGKQAFRRWLDEGPPRSLDELLLKVFFASFASRAALRSQLEEYRDDQTALLDEYRAIERRIADDPRGRYGYLTLRYGIAHTRCRLRWVDEAIEELA